MASDATTPRDRLGFTLFLAVAIHAAVILGVSFSSSVDVAESSTIEVTLSRYSDEKAPEEADFIAESNQLGGGTEAEIQELTATEEANFQDNQFRQVMSDPLPDLEEARRDKRELLASATSEADPVTTTNEIQQDPLAATMLTDNPAANALAREIASLEARIAAEQNARAKQPRVKRLTSVSTKSADEAAYLNMWRQKVERVGNANYPAGVFGTLRMLVVLNYDGNLRDVRLLESSGYPSLDDAAMRIVRIAAPFHDFPVEMRKKYDQLEIIRTWKFARGATRLGT